MCKALVVPWTLQRIGKWQTAFTEEAETPSKGTQTPGGPEGGQY